MSALTVMGGTAAFAGERQWNDNHKKDKGSAALDNSGDAFTKVSQDQKVLTAQVGLANSGKNHAVNIVAGVNLGKQKCESNLSGGNILLADDKNTAGNEGGNCDNDATASNNNTGTADVDTGDASAPNTANTDVEQTNGGGSSVKNTANNNKVKADDGPAKLDNSGDATLWVHQDSKVATIQGSYANTGHNTAIGAVIGVNAGKQTGTSNVHGGNILLADDKNTAGNNGGNVANTSHASNNGLGTASIKTGNATASNNSTTNVTQTNTGGSSVQNSATGNTVKSD